MFHRLENWSCTAMDNPIGPSIHSGRVKERALAIMIVLRASNVGSVVTTNQCRDVPDSASDAPTIATIRIIISPVQVVVVVVVAIRVKRVEAVVDTRLRGRRCPLMFQLPAQHMHQLHRPAAPMHPPVLPHMDSFTLAPRRPAIIQRLLRRRHRHPMFPLCHRVYVPRMHPRVCHPTDLR